MGDKPKSDLILRCFQSWKENLPDYEFVEWGNASIDLINNRYLKEAFTHKKWAFVSDVIRLHTVNSSPDRISIKKKSIPNEELNKYYMTFCDIKNTNSNESISSIFALQIWNIGRHALINKNTESARKCFETSLNIYPELISKFSINYRFMKNFMSYESIEKIISFRKQFTKFRKRLFR